jgi:hypothetical protein
MGRNPEDEPRSIYIYTEKLTEGDVFPFLLLRQIEIPGDDEFFLMESQQGNRLLIPFKHYQNYGFEPGITVNCKVDKINCNGRVYLEPEHPFYKPGHDYCFTLLNRFEFSDRKNRLIARYNLKGEWVNPVEADIRHDNALTGGLLFNARLLRIRKGVLYLDFLLGVNDIY